MSVDEAQVLVMPGHPNGDCPAHVMTVLQCNNRCMVARIEFAQAARELDRFWRQTIRNAQAEAA